MSRKQTAGSNLRVPADLKILLAVRYERQRRAWLLGGGDWPLRVPLGAPSEDEALADLGAVRSWSMAWAESESAIAVDKVERSWPRIGRHVLPAHAVLASPEEVADLIGEGRRWRRAKRRADDLQRQFAGLTGHPTLGKHFDALADYADEDFERVRALLTWARQDARPSGLYLRQLPIEGLDTKWIGSRRALARDLLLAIAQGSASAEADLEMLLGVRKAPARLRIRLLCSALRAASGGLGDIEAPVGQIAALSIAPRRVIIVENLETGLALPDVDDCVCFMKLGAAVTALGAIPWLNSISRAIYWGDIDTHGFAILDQARAVLPDLRSVLMTGRIMDEHAHLRGKEPEQAPVRERARLTAEERQTLEGLYAGRWGTNARLEQERLHWPTALAGVMEALGHEPAPEERHFSDHAG